MLFWADFPESNRIEGPHQGSPLIVYQIVHMSSKNVFKSCKTVCQTNCFCIFFVYLMLFFVYFHVRIVYVIVNNVCAIVYNYVCRSE